MFESFEAALRSWIASVALIEVGYVGECEEYTLIELVAGDYLDELARRSGPRWAAYIEQTLAPWDERFRSATIEEPVPHLVGEGREPGWWQYRSPRRWRRPGSEEMERLCGRE